VRYAKSRSSKALSLEPFHDVMLPTAPGNDEVFTPDNLNIHALRLVRASFEERFLQVSCQAVCVAIDVVNQNKVARAGVTNVGVDGQVAAGIAGDEVRMMR